MNPLRERCVHAGENAFALACQAGVSLKDDYRECREISESNEPARSAKRYGITAARKGGVPWFCRSSLSPVNRCAEVVLKGTAA